MSDRATVTWEVSEELGLLLYKLRNLAYYFQKEVPDYQLYNDILAEALNTNVLHVFVDDYDTAWPTDTKLEWWRALTLVAYNRPEFLKHWVAIMEAKRAIRDLDVNNTLMYVVESD